MGGFVDVHCKTHENYLQIFFYYYYLSVSDNLRRNIISGDTSV